MKSLIPIIIFATVFFIIPYSLRIIGACLWLFDDDYKKGDFWGMITGK